MVDAGAAGATPEGFEAGSGAVEGVGASASVVGFVLSDGVEEAVDGAGGGGGGDGVAGGAGEVAHDRGEVLEILQNTRAGGAVPFLNRSGEAIAVGGFEDATGEFGGEADVGHVLKVPDAFVEGLALDVDEAGEVLDELVDVGGVAGSEAGAVGDGGGHGATGEVAEFVGAGEAAVAEGDAEGGRAVVGVEGVEVAADAVTGDDFVLELEGGGDEEFLTLADGEDGFDLDVFAEVVEEVDEALVLDGGVAAAVEAKEVTVVGAANRAVAGGDAGGAVEVGEVGRELFSGPVEAGEFEGFGGGDALGEEVAYAAGEGGDGVAAFAVLAIDQDVVAGGNSGLRNGVEGAGAEGGIHGQMKGKGGVVSRW